MDPLRAFRLDSKVVVLTGASSGLGAGFARALSAVGADLVLVARRTDRLEEVAGDLRRGPDRGRAVTVTADVSVPEECRRVAVRAVEEFGRIDVLVNNAGLGSAVPASRETPDGFTAVIDVNLGGAFGRKGIRVNALCPGYFASEMTAEADDQLRAMVAGHSMLGRFGQQPELDSALLFLASPASSYVTGTSLLVDGGMAAL